MRIHKLIPTVLSVALVATAASAQLLPAGPDDLAADVLVAAPAAKGVAVPRDAVSLSWPLEAAAALETPQPFVARSREYFVDVTAEDLIAGVPVYTTRPGALVRLNPAGVDAGVAGKAAIAPASLVLTDPAGKAHVAGTGMDLIVGPEQLKAAGAPFAEGTSAFRIREELGAGTFRLGAQGLATGGRRYVIHVLDRLSPVELSLQTAATDYLHGQTLTVEASLADDGRRFRARRLEGFVSSPAGRAWPLEFRHAGRGIYRATLELDALELPSPGLWEVHATVKARRHGLAVLRAGRTAFGVAVPSARLTGGERVDGGLAVRLGVETASPGRYEARGVLWATGVDGSLRPAAVAHSAAWLGAGQGALELGFDRAGLAERGFGAPYEVRDLRLVDQVTMGLLHRQERALALDE